MDNQVIDLTWGNAEFLTPYWYMMQEQPDAAVLQSRLALHDSMNYEKEGGREELKKQILLLHQLVGNAETSGKHVVIGAGATQILLAALTSMNENNDLFGCYVKKPHYLRFPGLINMAGVTKITEESMIPIGRKSAEIITWPNNPDGNIYPASQAPLKIHDLCYNWPQYTNQVVRYNEDIMIFSLSKATGHAATRIGWALVRDERVARMMAYYVELVSNGVSVEAQDRARKLLQSQNYLLAGSSDQNVQTVFTFGKIVLEDRWKRLKEIKSDRFKILNSQGMFAMVQFGEEALGRDAAYEFLMETGVAGVPGDMLGAPGNQIRFNIGCEYFKFEEFLEALKLLSSQ